MIETKENIHPSYRYTKGKEYSLDLNEYIGEYHLRGSDAYTGPIKTSESRKLEKYHPAIQVLRYNSLKPENIIAMTYVEPTFGFVYPSDTAYTEGVFYRFFVKYLGPAESVIEIDMDQASNYGIRNGIDPNLYQLGELKWYITRNISRLKWVETENKKSAIDLNLKMRGVSNIIYSYTQFSEISI
jgi:hypothetical protein